MILNYIFHNSSLKTYENKNENIKKNKLTSFQSCIENMSITFVLFGSFMIIFNIFMNFFYIRRDEFSISLKLFFITSGLWAIIIMIQMLTFFFSSNFFENSTHLLLNYSKNKKDKWNPFNTGIFLTNVLTFSCISILSFYGIFSYITNMFNFTNASIIASIIFSLSMNLIFVSMQFLYIFLRVYQIKNIEFNYYLSLFLPGFAYMLELIEMKIKSKIRENLLDKKSKKKHKQKIIYQNIHQDENLYLIN
ncbi:conserved Plasmodium protein, unknown function [Plasmodium gallinaceum]|uniref:Transmembrane protein n=1 Tax=Plasmodium gallinaceum TaxID=5849 RepID=A0A1J1GNC0_PLAGA|nr:conserved Plasmodium protein, unknown function [Plasmodium gallinaceum]CRG93969.1 conserved Plasmodium protein, unknown function [Plasmodium gallinaceum]